MNDADVVAPRVDGESNVIGGIDGKRTGNRERVWRRAAAGDVDCTDPGAVGRYDRDARETCRIEQRDLIQVRIEDYGSVRIRLIRDVGVTDFTCRAGRAPPENHVLIEENRSQRLIERVEESDLRQIGVRIRKYRRARNRIDRDSLLCLRDAELQVRVAVAHRTNRSVSGSPGNRVIHRGLRVRKVVRVDDGDARKGAVEICIRRRDTADEDGARVRGIDVMSGRGRDGNDVGGADRTCDPYSRRFLRQVDSLENSRAAGRDVSKMNTRLQRDLRVLAGGQADG